MIEIDLRDCERLAVQLDRVAHRAMPHAARNAINAAAFQTRAVWVDRLGKQMTLRNTFTARSVRVEKARGTDIEAMQSVVGSVAPYLLTQEEGATLPKDGTHGVPIPTPVSSGEGRGARPRKRMVRRPNRLPAIQLGPRLATSNRKQRNAAAISSAVRSGRKYVFLELERRKGLFRISGGKRNPKLDMIWDLSQPAVRVPRNPTLEPSLRVVEGRLPHIMKRAVVEQLRRNRLLGY